MRWQVITCAEFHPNMCHSFAYSTSKGCIKLGDLRASALCDRHTKSFETLEPPVRFVVLQTRKQLTCLRPCSCAGCCSISGGWPRMNAPCNPCQTGNWEDWR